MRATTAKEKAGSKAELRTEIRKPEAEAADPVDTFKPFPVMKTVLMGATAAVGFMGGTGTAHAAQPVQSSISVQQQTSSNDEVFDLKGFLADAKTENTSNERTQNLIVQDTIKPGATDPILREPPPEVASDTTKTGEKAKWSGSISHTNDSLPFGTGTLQEDEKIPGTDIADDDGWTAELRFDLTRTEGDQQWVLAGRHAMVTQQGAWEPTPDYQGFRTDVGEIALQKNFRVELNDRANLTYGVGGGLQGVGNLGGRQLQEWWHNNGGFGGRTGSALQGNYSTSGVEFSPILTGGAGITYDLNSSGSLKALGQVQGTLALGNGLSTIRSEAGLQYSPFSRVSLEAGLKADASYATARGLDFYDTDGFRTGAYGQISVEALKGVTAFGRFEDGGFRNEPVFSVGFKIGIGSKPWLNPVGNSY